MVGVLFPLSPQCFSGVFVSWTSPCTYLAKCLATSHKDSVFGPAHEGFFLEQPFIQVGEDYDSPRQTLSLSSWKLETPWVLKACHRKIGDLTKNAMAHCIHLTWLRRAFAQAQFELHLRTPLVERVVHNRQHLLMLLWLLQRCLAAEVIAESLGDFAFGSSP